MKLNPANILGSWYADETLSWSAQKTVNWLPETAEVEGTRTITKFADAPGLRAVVTLGTNAPIRGMENVEGRLFVVSGASLFEVFTDFTTDNKGNIPGVSRVSMTHNKQGGVTAANELFIANGLSGYVYNTATDVLSQVTDEGFEGALTADYVDGYTTITDPQGRFWAHSSLNQATQWSTIDRYDAESAPDKIVSHIVSHREVMVFGQRTTEFFRNTGAATGTFQRVDGTELEIGICSPFARVRVDNSVGWVGNDLTVYRLSGHSAQRISTRPIEQMLARVDPNNIFCDTWEDRGHKVLYVTSPQLFTLGYDFASQMWHERESYQLPRWRMNNVVAWNGLRIVGDFTNGLLYALDWDTHHENGAPLVRERATGYTHSDQNKVRAAYAELLFDVGVGSTEDILTISGDLPGGEVNIPITPFQYLVTGGIGPYIVTLTGGALPDGLSMDSDGLVTGTPTTPGTFSWTVTVTDAFGDTDDHNDDATFVESIWGLTHSDDFTAITAHDWTAPATSTPGLFNFNMIEVMGSRISVGQVGAAASYRTSTTPTGPWVSGTGAIGMRSMTSGGGRWYLGRDDGAYSHSDDGTTFATKIQPSGTMMANGDLVYANFSVGDLNRSLDRGDNWISASHPFSPYRAAFVLARDPESSTIAMGDCDDTPTSLQPRFATSANAGGTWTVSPTLPVLPVASFISGVCRTPQSWIMVTDSGRILYRLDSDGIWVLNSFLGTQLNDVSSDGTIAYAVGNNGQVIKTMDYGVTWSAVPQSIGVVNFTRIRKIS